ncbi:MAG: hypothetical protein NZM33_17280 [Bryobacteraceae bacterium]|nr:hypothetical protein [Bryobacteraceae bacterium]
MADADAGAPRMTPRTLFGTWFKRSTTPEQAAPLPAPTQPVSPRIAQIFRQGGTRLRANASSPSCVDDQRAGPGERDNPTAMPAQPAPVAERRMRFQTAAPQALMSSRMPEGRAPEENALFRKRVAMQRASNAWGPLLTAWNVCPAACHGVWTLPGLMSAIREEAAALANQACPGGAEDDRLRMAFVAMMARCLAGELRYGAQAGHPLPQDVTVNIARDLAALVEEPPVRSLPDATGEEVVVRGRSSMALSLADAAIRLLPPLARHAGTATRDTLANLLGVVHHRALSLADALLGENPTERARQSLVQSLLRRESDLLAAALDALPTAGPGSLSRGRQPLEHVIETYLRWSKDAEHAVTASLEAAFDESPVAPTTQPANDFRR